MNDKTKRIGVFAVIRRAPADVWNALTTVEGLTAWLARDADVELKRDGKFTLRSGTPMSSGEHRVTGVEAGHSIDIEWRLEGHPTQVRWEVVPEGEHTKIVVRHAVAPDVPVNIDDPLGGEASVLNEMWAYNIGLLKTYLELGDAKCRLDPDRKPEPVITHELEIGADPKAVFAALVEPEEIKKWNPFAPAPKVERRVGGNYSFGWESEDKKTDGPGEIIEYEDGHKITYTWHGNPPTLLSWTVEPLPDNPGRTRIKFTHSGFNVDQNMLVGWTAGWGGFLQSMALALEAGITPDWLGYVEQ